MSASQAIVYLVEEEQSPRLVPIGTAVVGEDGRTLLITIDKLRTFGPETPLIVRGI